MNRQNSYMLLHQDYLPSADDAVAFLNKIACAVQLLVDRNMLDTTHTPDSSNGSSVVLFSKPSLNLVFQTFDSHATFEKVHSIASKLDSQHFATVQPSQLQVELSKFSTMIWKKITPLHSLKNMQEYVIQNFDKFEYDMKFALDCLHEIGYIHNDCSLDNIGIDENEQFILYDFDASKKSAHVELDHNTLNRSLLYHKIGRRVNFSWPC